MLRKEWDAKKQHVPEGQPDESSSQSNDESSCGTLQTNTFMAGRSLCIGKPWRLNKVVIDKTKQRYLPLGHAFLCSLLMKTSLSYEERLKELSMTDSAVRQVEGLLP